MNSDVETTVDVGKTGMAEQKDTGAVCHAIKVHCEQMWRLTECAVCG